MLLGGSNKTQVCSRMVAQEPLIHVSYYHSIQLSVLYNRCSAIEYVSLVDSCQFSLGR